MFPVGADRIPSFFMSVLNLRDDPTRGDAREIRYATYAERAPERAARARRHRDRRGFSFPGQRRSA